MAEVSAVVPDEILNARRSFRQEVSQILAQAGFSGNRFGTAAAGACWAAAVEDLSRRFDLLLKNKAKQIPQLNHPVDSVAVKELPKRFLSELLGEKEDIEAVFMRPGWVANPGVDEHFKIRFQALADSIPDQLRGLTEQLKRTLRPSVLFVGVDPSDRIRLRLDREVKGVEEALRSSGLGDRFSLEQLWAATFLDLQHALLRYQPAVLHFSGHGTPSGELALERDLQVPYESRRPGPSDQRPAEALARMLGAIDDSGLRCVVLNACFSEVQAAEVARHADCVVGLFAEVHDSAAIEFARGFYGALSWGKSVQVAFDLGVAQVKSQSDASLYRLIAPKADPRTVKLLDPPL